METSNDDIDAALALNAVLPSPSYEREVLKLAKKENIIVCLGDADKRPLVAGLVLEHLLATAGHGNIAAFVVPRISLVQQYSLYLRRISKKKLKIGHIYGDMGIDCWRRHMWDDEFQRVDAFIMTSEACLNGLRHALFSLDTVKLLIIDECHDATKNHPCNVIMSEFYHKLAPGKQRPRVVGITELLFEHNQHFGESTIHGDFNIWEALEQTLDARIVTVEEIASNSLNAAGPQEFVLVYMPSEITFAGFKEGKSYEEYEAHLKEAEGRVLDKALVDEHCELPNVSMKVENAGTREEAEFIYAYISRELGTIAAKLMTSRVFGDFPFRKILKGIPRISDKAYQLMNFVCTEYRRWKSLESNSPFRCVISVSHRCLAWGVALMLNHFIGGSGTQELHAETMTCRFPASASQLEECMEIKKHRDTILGFQRGDFGILVCTDVLREGIDFPFCELFVTFEDIESVASYVRSRGRASGRFARYAVLIPRHGVDNVRKLRNMNVVRAGSELTRFVVTSPRRRPRATEEGRPAVNSTEISLLSKTTGARVPLYAAVDLVARYCQLLPRGAKYWDPSTWKPQYRFRESLNGFTCTVILPVGAPVRTGSCSVAQAARSDAKALAALDAYKTLYEQDLVDQYLLPAGSSYLRRFVEGEDMNNIHDSPLRLPDKRLDRLEPHKLRQPGALCWDKELPTVVHLYRLSPVMDEVVGFKHASTHGIITPNKILDEDLHSVDVSSGQRLFVMAWVGSLVLSRDRFELAIEYARLVHAIAINRVCCLSEGYQAGLTEETETRKTTGLVKSPGYLYVPLSSKQTEAATYKVAWDKMAELTSYDFRFGPQNQDRGGNEVECLENAIVQSCHDKKVTLYFTLDVIPGLSIESPCTPYLSPELPYSCIGDYYAGRHATKVEDASQALVRAYNKCGWHAEMKNPFVLVPEFCRIVPLPKIAVAIAEELPNWQKFMAAKDAFRRLSFKGRGASIFEFCTSLTPCTAFCKPLEHYERLEFLGDAVLKCFTSIYVFLGRAIDHEGVLSFHRDYLISNRKLCDVARSLRLGDIYAYTSSATALTVCKFYMAPQGTTCYLSSKVLADVVESLIGLDFHYNGVTSVPGLLDCFGITREFRTMISQPFIRAFLRPVQDAREVHARHIIEHAETVLRYKFKDKLLLLEALTHPSYRDAGTPSYQRLEFLGDAILCLVITKHLYDEHPSLEPAELSTLREIAVSNELFGRLLIKLGLHSRIFHESEVLANRMNMFTESLEKEDPKSKLISTLDVECPKVLGDVWESIVGAILVDVCNDMTMIWPLLKGHLLPLFERFCDPLTVLKHPVARCAHMLQKLHGATPEYRFERVFPRSRRLRTQNDAGVPDYRTICRVLCKGEVLIEAHGINRKKAKRKAAQMVCDMLEKKAASAGARGRGILRLNSRNKPFQK